MKFWNDCAISVAIDIIAESVRVSPWPRDGEAAQAAAMVLRDVVSELRVFRALAKAELDVAEFKRARVHGSR